MGPKTSPTAIATDQRCRRERYLSREAGDHGGWVPTKVEEDYEIGIRIHAGMEAFFRSAAESDGRAGVDTARALAAALSSVRAVPLSEPWQTWLEASLTAWALRVWPELAQRYKVLMVEEMLRFERNGVTYKVKPDLVLEDTTDGTVWVYDFKSYSWWDNKKWVRDLQMQIGCVAVAEKLGREVAGCIIQGIYKGTVRGDKLYHDLVFGYIREGEPGVTKTAYAYGYKKGFERFNVLAYPGGVEAWVKGAPDSVIADCVPRTAPIFLNKPMMEEFLYERGRREQEISAMADLIRKGITFKPQLMADVYPHNTSQCESGRRTCAYFELCWQPVVAKDPEGSGLYRKRYPDGEKGEDRT